MFETKKTFIIEEVEAEKEEQPKVIENKPVDKNADPNLRACPECSEITLKIENGCNSCVNPECGYGKCDI